MNNVTQETYSLFHFLHPVHYFFKKRSNVQHKGIGTVDETSFINQIQTCFIKQICSIPRNNMKNFINIFRLLEVESTNLS